MSELPTCLLDLPHDAVRLILASLDTWTTAVDDLNFLRWWNAMKLCCVSLYSICKAYEPQLCKAARIARRANLILTPNDRRWHYGYHEILPYCKMDPKPEQMTKIPEKLLEQSDFLRNGNCSSGVQVSMQALVLRHLPSRYCDARESTMMVYQLLRLC